MNCCLSQVVLVQFAKHEQLPEEGSLSPEHTDEPLVLNKRLAVARIDPKGSLVVDKPGEHKGSQRVEDKRGCQIHSHGS